MLVTPNKVKFRVVASKSSIDKFLSPPITPMKARAVKSFPIGKEWMYEPKWDGFRCLIFRDEENIFLQSRTGKSLTSAFPEIVAAFRIVDPKWIVLMKGWFIVSILHIICMTLGPGEGNAPSRCQSAPSRW